MMSIRYRAAVGAWDRAIELVELLEDAVELVRLNADAGV